jgi:thiol-disulfide isomerase/thioredoxin
MKNSKLVPLLIVSLAIVGGIIYLSKDKTGPSDQPVISVDVALPQVASSTESATVMSAKDRIATKAQQFDRAKELANPSGFVNTNGLPITLGQYVGKKVILLDVMTYSCINCIRTFPYLNDWYTKYEDKGLIIIGIHTPEFDFEKNIDNVKAAMAKYGIKFPVVLDNDYGTWNAYNNRYWPMKYLIDIDGFVRFTHIGEGGYDETEKNIQDLLKERADVLGLTPDVSTKIDMPVTTGSVEQGIPGQSPETYFGSNRNEFFGNGTPGQTGTNSYTIPKDISASTFYLGGSWNIVTDHAENTAIPAKIVYKFAAKHVYLVASADTAMKVYANLDGKNLDKTIGADVKENDGIDTFTVHGSRLYDIYSSNTFGVHTLELIPGAAGLKIFTFTFGN